MARSGFLCAFGWCVALHSCRLTGDGPIRQVCPVISIENSSFPGISFPRYYQLTLLFELRRCFMWTKPEYTEIRLGFESSMYCSTR